MTLEVLNVWVRVTDTRPNTNSAVKTIAVGTMYTYTIRGFYSNHKTLGVGGWGKPLLIYFS